MNERLANALLNKGFRLTTGPTSAWHVWHNGEQQLHVANNGHCLPEFDDEWAHVTSADEQFDTVDDIGSGGIGFDHAANYVEQNL